MAAALSARLMTIAEQIKGGAVADIGTDHALLPVFLLRAGRASHAFACDIAAGPLRSARRTVRAAGLEDHIDIIQYDGIPPQALACDTVVIAGMGGELIGRIVAQAGQIKRLLLQPMTRERALREALIAAGYRINAEWQAKEGQRIYTVIEALPGADAPFGDGEWEVGRARDDALWREKAEAEIARLIKCARGKEKAGENADAERKTADEIGRMLR